MWSVDGCRQGVPFSYATDVYEKGDNTFLIFNYNSWCGAFYSYLGVFGDNWGLGLAHGS